MPNFLPSIIVDTVIGALGSFIQPFVGTAQIVRGQTNRAAMPLTGFVELTELLQIPLETPISVETSDTVTITGPTRIDVQVDFYGPSSGDQCKSVLNVFRTQYATAQFPDNIAPLFCSDGRQGPLINAEQQYESRWTLTASLQYNPAVVIPLQSANNLAVNILEDVQQ
jgi:hypothetical protein